MTNATNNVARVAAVVAGLGLVASSFASIASAQTATTTSTTTTTTVAATFTRNLTIGSTGADVTALQTWLIGQGFSIPAGATGYFGAQTKAALASYQAAHSISPAAGYFGPITRAAVAAAGTTVGTTTGLPAGCTTTAGFSPTTGVSCSTTTTTTTTTTGPLTGGEGSLDNFKIVGASNTSLNASDYDTVYGFEFRANGSDLSVNRVDYDLYNSNNVGATRPWNVFSTAKLMRNNTVVATLDASDMNNWSQDGTAQSNSNQIYRLRFDGLKDVVKNGTTADYYLQLSTQNVISTSNSGAQYTIYLSAQGVRTTDAMGINEYSSSSNQSTGTISVSSNTSGQLVVSTGSDNPQPTTVQASTNAQTSDVTLTTFTLQAKDADVMVYTLPVSATTTATTTNGQLSDVVRSLKLYQGSTLLDTESYTAGGSATSVKFKNLTIKIPMGTTQSFAIKADINNVGSTNVVPEGTGLTVSVPATGWDAENSSGNNVTLTGAVTGNTITFRTLGVAVDSTPTSATATATAVGTTGTQSGSFTFTFNVTAFGQDIYFSKNAATAVTYGLFTNGTTSAATSSAALTSTADTSSNNNGNYVIHSGQTKQVIVTITVPAGNSTSINAVLNTFKFGTTDTAPAANTVTLTNNYQTPPVFIHS